ncbi:MAG: sulfatase-like hydrolase/transferase [Planctomycetaceae bacterium]|nr:sulfatase-like hydrolase/transferase [Planctomycetaceae bacterium]
MKIAFLFLPLFRLALGELSIAHAAPPNIVFIYADDWGWGDLACHGHAELKTPHLDRLAREGTDFHQFTVCNPVCSPSRTAIITGQYPARHRIHEAIADHDSNEARGMPDWLDPNVVTLPRLLHQSGYTTGHFGKWHLGGRNDDSAAPRPAAYGYDASAVWVGGGADVWAGSSYEKDGGPAGDRGTAHSKIHACLMSSAATEHALRFIRQAGDKPFYVNLWLHEAHHLVAATDEDKLAYPDTPEPRRTYYSALTRADALVGKVLALLDERNLARNTIVVFSSDNGPENSHPNPGDKFYYSVGTTGGLKGRKRSLYLGGVNVPFLVRWPEQVPAGRVDKTSVISGVDVLPTLLAAAGVAMPGDYRPDGVDVLSAWRGEKFVRPQPVFWDWRGTHASDVTWPELGIRDGDWTLLMTRDGGRIELYDVVNDRGQARNVASSHPDRVRKLTEALLQWRDTLPPLSAADPAKSRRKRPPTAPTKPAPTKPAPDRARAFARWNKDGDDALTLEEYRDGLADPTHAEKRFKAFDKNGDGKLTREEFVGSTQR